MNDTQNPGLSAETPTLIPPDISAEEYATLAHASTGQTRKYSGRPYIEHPARVVGILKSVGITDKNLLDAGWLHDVIEDVTKKMPQFNLKDIRARFGWQVEFLTDELTDRFPHEAFPEANRATRQQLEAERISRASEAALKVKLADIIDNTSDIVKHDPLYARAKYLPEKQRILALLTNRVAASNDAILKKLYQMALGNIHQ